MDPVDVAWKAFQVLSPFVAAGLATVSLRRRERITWEESAKGHLAKLRHEALAKCLAGLGELYELRYAPEGDTEEERTAFQKRTTEALREVAAHEFMLPPALRENVQGMLDLIRPAGSASAIWEGQARHLCATVDVYLPAIDPRGPLPTLPRHMADAGPGTVCMEVKV